MLDFRRVSEPDPSCATVRIYRNGEAVLARITWPALGRPSNLVGPTVGSAMLPAIALDVASAAVEAGTVPDAVVIVEDDEAMWDREWGRLV